MKPDAKDALSRVLDHLSIGPDTTSPRVFYNASPLPDMDESWEKSLVCEQPDRATFLTLQKHGYVVQPELSENSTDTHEAIVLLGRNRLVNEHRIAKAWNGIVPGGRLMVAGNKTDGVGSIRKWFASHVGLVESSSKFHAVVFWANKREGVSLPVKLLDKNIEGYLLSEGMFSADGPDPGSVLLSNHFSEKIVGKVADIGAGWGFLSSRLLEASDRVLEIDLFEADFHSLNAARTNVSSSGVGIEFHWIDVTTEFPKKPYNWVIMNPPFHSGRAAEPGLGRRFIEVAASTLPRGGRMLMVANQNLPYEKELDRHFRKVEKLGEKDGFKVIEALK